MLHAALDRLHRATARLLLHTVSPADPWRRFPYPVPLDRYGAGARRDFSWYLEGESDVAVTSLDELRVWLLGCAYARDPELFGAPDVWQHPSDFEGRRAGDCEDFALWTWRKLIDLGHDAELVVGRRGGDAGTGHAWVLLHASDGPHLVDPVVRDDHRIIRPLPDVRDAYLPEASVDCRLVRYVYAGYLRHRRAQAAVAAPLIHA